jgi:tetratricopeptide (TPR) repeat protein
MGSHYRKNGLWDQARDCFEKACEEGLPEDKFLYEIALLHQGQGKSDAFSDTIETIETMGSQDAEILLGLGNAALADRNYEKADTFFKRASEKGLEDAIIRTNWAVACKAMGKIDEAIEHNLKASDIQPDMPEAVINLGHLYFDQNQYDEAQSCFLKALNLQPNAVDVYLRLGLISLSRGHVEHCTDIATIVLKILGKTAPLAINGTKDLASVYRMISHDFKTQGSSILSNDAARIASILNQHQDAVAAGSLME